jgi:hypothetical protein
MMSLSVDDDLEKKDDLMVLSMMNTNYYRLLAKVIFYTKKTKLFKLLFSIPKDIDW